MQNSPYYTLSVGLDEKTADEFKKICRECNLKQKTLMTAMLKHLQYVYETQGRRGVGEFVKDFLGEKAW